MILKYVFLTILSLVSLAIISERNNLRLVIYFSAFSLIAASLYFFNFAPDVALAEIAIGSALMPLILTITISKQRIFTVLGDTDHLLFLEACSEDGKNGSCSIILEEFCNHYDLKLELINQKNHQNKSLHGVFREYNVDLIVHYDEETRDLFFIGKDSSILMHKLEKTTRNYPKVSTIRVSDYETTD